MAEKADPGIVHYCANIMRPQLEILRKKAQNTVKRKNIEDIHDLRVASRRIRTCLTIFAEFFPAKKLRSWEKDIKGITSAYGKVRDLDVQIDLLNKVFDSVTDPKIRAGLRRVRLRLKQKREKEQTKTAVSTRALLQSPDLQEMNAWCEAALASQAETAGKSLEIYQLGYKNIQGRLDEFLFFEVFLFDPARVDELHQMRIAAKRLRYSLEVFSGLYDAKSDFALEIARQTQQYLGEIHDADVWIAFLPKFLQKEQSRVQAFYGNNRPFARLKPGIDYLINNRKKERDRQYKLFVEEWREWKMKESWLNLRKLIFLTSLEEPNLPNPDMEPPSDPDIRI